MIPARSVRSPLIFILALVLICSLTPTLAFADEGNAEGTESSQAEASEATSEDTSRNSSKGEVPLHKNTESEPNGSDSLPVGSKENSEEKTAGENPVKREQDQKEALPLEESATPENTENKESGDIPLTELTHEGLITYRSHVQSIGWQNYASDGTPSGTTGSAKRLEALEITLGGGLQGSVSYRTHVQSLGWQPFVRDGTLAGTIGVALRMEALEISLFGAVADAYDIYYRAHAQSVGWLGWASNGAPSGTAGYGLRLEAVEIILISKGGAAPGQTTEAFKVNSLTYQAHVSKIGWQKQVGANEVAGTIGQARALEALSIDLTASYPGSVAYQSYVQYAGWQESVSGGKTSGTTGQARAIQALKISLSGDISMLFDVYYRVHAESVGWLGWARNGEVAGTLGYDRRIEALQIMLVPIGQNTPGGGDACLVFSSLTYQAHVSSVGWLAPVSEGVAAATTGQAKTLEALCISLYEPVLSGSMEYRTHVQSIGWQDYVKDGALAGTVGERKSIQAIQMRLTGDLALTYDIYYRAHCSKMGWLDWAKNDEMAGSVGCSMPLENIEVKLVSKSSTAPGDTTRPSISFTYEYSANIAGQGWQQAATQGASAGTIGKSQTIEQIQLALTQTNLAGTLEYCTQISSVGWTDYVAEGDPSGVSGEQVEAIRIRLTDNMKTYFDVYYRAYTESFGWLGWAKNDAAAGSATLGLRMEAYQVVIVSKAAGAPGETGRAYVESLSGDFWLDAQIRSIAASNGYDLRRCYNFVAAFPYISGSLWPSGAWEVPFAKEMLQRGGGNCYRYAALFCMLARQLGYNARVVAGAVPSRSQGRAPHGWVEINMNEQVYVFDPDMAHAIPSYNWYMITYINAPINYYR